MVKLIWVRHAMTIANQERRYIGHSDAPLSTEGRIQAENAALYLRDRNVAAIYTSDLRRAAATASEIAKYHPQVEVQQTTDLRELYFGDWEGLTYEEIAARDEQRIISCYDDPWANKPPGGESMDDLSKRLTRFIDQIIHNHRGESVLAVSHGGVLRLFQSLYLHPEVSVFSVPSVAHGAMLFCTYDHITGEWRDETNRSTTGGN